MKKNVTGKIDSIQGLRALAALLVVVSHQLPEVGLLSKEHGFYAGTLGVMMFFIISGFIMVTTSYDRFGTPRAPSEFIWRRIIRIVPLYWLATAIYATKQALIGHPPTVAELLQSFAFIPYLNEHGIFQPLYALGWTLNYEMFFYVLFAIALTQRFWVGVIGLLSALVGLIAVGVLFPSITTGSELLRFWTGPIMQYFVVGVLAGLLRQRLLERGGLGPERVTGTFVAATVLVSFFVWGAIYAPWLRLLEPVLCMGIFAMCAFRQGGSDSGLVERWIILIGNASYSIYLTHSFVAGPVKRVSTAVFHGQYPLLVVAAITAASIALGLASYRWVETPALRLKWQRGKRLWGRSQSIPG